MPTISKRTKQARNLIIKPSYSLEEGVKILKQTATTKFVESAEAHFNLNLIQNIVINNYVQQLAYLEEPGRTLKFQY